MNLTPRQREVIRLMERGFTNGQIAERLGVTLDGAKFHVAEIMSKLGASSREEAVALWGARPRTGWHGLAASKILLGVAGVLCVAGALGVVALLRGGPGESNPTAGGLVACPTIRASTPIVNVVADWVDFVNFEGVHYLGRTDIQGLRPAAPYGRVQLNVSETWVDALASRQDCQAAFLPVGEVLYRIDGYDPHFRVVTKDGKVYEAYGSSDAKTAGEFIDLRGKVTRIVVRSSSSELSVGEIGDQATIEKLVDYVESAEVDNAPLNQSGPWYLIEFQLNDGTKWVASFWPDRSRIAPGLVVPEEFGEAIRAAVARTP